MKTPSYLKKSVDMTSSPWKMRLTLPWFSPFFPLQPLYTEEQIIISVPDEKICVSETE